MPMRRTLPSTSSRCMSHRCNRLAADRAPGGIWITDFAVGPCSRASFVRACNAAGGTPPYTYAQSPLVPLAETALTLNSTGVVSGTTSLTGRIHHCAGHHRRERTGAAQQGHGAGDRTGRRHTAAGPMTNFDGELPGTSAGSPSSFPIESPHPNRRGPVHLDGRRCGTAGGQCAATRNDHLRRHERRRLVSRRHADDARWVSLSLVATDSNGQSLDGSVQPGGVESRNERQLAAAGKDGHAVPRRRWCPPAGPRRTRSRCMRA